MTSVIIPARNEPHIDKTIKSVTENAIGDVEIVVVVDGPGPRPELADNVIVNEEPKGTRVARNQGAVVAAGEFLLHIDGHCTMSRGWDVKMAASCSEKTIVVSPISPLTPEFEDKNGWYSFCSIDKNIATKWWGAYKPRKECGIEEDTMSFTGCGWMIRKDFYWDIGGFDESYAMWGEIGAEMALKVWIEAGGKVVLRTDVLCGHMFKRDFGYKLEGPKVTETKKIIRARYEKKMAWLVSKFAPVPGWDQTEDAPAKTSEVEVKVDKWPPKCREVEYIIGTLLALPHEGPEITAIMKVYGDHKVQTEEAIESFIRQRYKNKRLLIINTHKDEVYLNKDHPQIDVVNTDEKFESIGMKAMYGIRMVKSPFWCIMDDDDIFLPWHLPSLADAYKAKYGDPKSQLRRVCGFRISSSKNEIERVGVHPLWTSCLFERMTDEQLDSVSEEAAMAGGFDMYMMKEVYKECHRIPRGGAPSVIYRWGNGGHHGSAAGRANPQDPNSHYIRVNREANKIDIKEPHRPHWEKDYLMDLVRVYIRDFTGWGREPQAVTNEPKPVVSRYDLHVRVRKEQRKKMGLPPAMIVEESVYGERDILCASCNREQKKVCPMGCCAGRAEIVEAKARCPVERWDKLKGKVNAT